MACATPRSRPLDGYVNDAEGGATAAPSASSEVVNEHERATLPGRRLGRRCGTGRPPPDVPGPMDEYAPSGAGKPRTRSCLHHPGGRHDQAHASSGLNPPPSRSSKASSISTSVWEGPPARRRGVPGRPRRRRAPVPPPPRRRGRHRAAARRHPADPRPGDPSSGSAGSCTSTTACGAEGRSPPGRGTRRAQPASPGSSSAGRQAVGVAGVLSTGRATRGSTAHRKVKTTRITPPATHPRWCRRRRRRRAARPPRR